MIGRLAGWMQAIGPVRAAFLGSLLLSAVAVWNTPVLNRDGMFYVEWAREIAGHGIEGAGQNGLLLALLPAAIAAGSALTGLGHETAAHLLNALFMAGACGLLVAIVRRRLPEAAWVACLVVLAMPGYNEYRGQVLREYGLWFFGLLALWLAVRWEETGRWREALACQAALFAAALFRIEALAYFPALMLWQLLAAPAGTRLRRALMIGCLPLAGAAVAGLLFASGLAAVPHRLAYLSQAFNPLAKLHAFNDVAGRMSDLLFGHKYTREEAAYVLFFGLLTIIPVKFLKMSGVLVVPMAYAFAGRRLRAALAPWQPLGWIFLAHALALAAYVTYQYFLVGRYVAMLNLLAVPFAAAGLAALMRRFPRWRGLMVALALLTLLANVVSFSPKSTQIVEAGKWLAVNVKDPSRVYVDNPRVGFYGGLGYVRSGLLRHEVPTHAEAFAQKRFDLFVLDVPRKDGEAERWLSANGFRVVQRFANRAGDAVIVAIPAGAQPSPATIERKRSNTGPTE
ncbi:MAG: glycosyltransferase family 39 protein [Rhodocyclaceae bacterium]|nr:glycosyltransferase family 39 protein [Rhodocyclaceae bacterium]